MEREGEVPSRSRPAYPKGAKRNRKRIAEVGAAYDAAPAPRTAADILPQADAEREAAPAGPKAKGRGLTASVVEDAATVVGQLFDEASRRDPAPPKGLGRARRRQQPPDRPDRGRGERARRPGHDSRGLRPRARIPVEGRLVLPRRGAPRRRGWVRRHAQRILDGQATRVAGAIRRQATKDGLDPPARAGADTCAAYLTNKAAYLDYPTALKAGWPIATGVIEGAGRHLVKDRIDLAGARWRLEGAEAILKLRAIRNNGDFEEYWRFHLAREHERVHLSRYADGVIPQAE